MATIDKTRVLEPEQCGADRLGRPDAWPRCSTVSESAFEQTGYYHGLRELAMKDSDPLHFEKLFSRVRGGMVTARETALNISASPIVRELGEICFALYTPEGDNVALSTGIIVHVHTMSEAIKFMVRNGWEDNPGDPARATSSPTTSRRSATSTTPTSRPSSRSSTPKTRASCSAGPAASST